MAEFKTQELPSNVWYMAGFPSNTGETLRIWAPWTAAQTVEQAMILAVQRHPELVGPITRGEIVFERVRILDERVLIVTPEHGGDYASPN